jgi:hypothetical protein
MTKLTHEFVESYFMKQDCKLLSRYINNRTKIKYMCKCGNISTITFGDFKHGRRCGCKIKDFAKKRRHSIEFIKNVFNQKNCILLEINYLNTHHPMRYICVCGKESKISFAAFQSGRRCKECGINKNRHPQYPLNHVMKKKCQSLLKNTLIAIGKRKITKTKILLGYGTQELWEHIVNHTNWDRVKKTKWELDHIFPISAFVKYNILDIKLINSLDNLQPLEATENNKKRNKYNKTEFEDWLKRKGAYDLL